MEGPKFERKIERKIENDKPSFMSRPELLAELELLRPGQHIAIETDAGTFKGQVSFLDGRGGHHAFSMTLSEPAELKGSQLEFLSPSDTLTGAAPEDPAQAFRFSIVSEQGRQPEQWTKVRRSSVLS